jgi:hypothetical protein
MGKVRSILEHIDDAIQETGKEVRSYIKRHAEFKEIGKSMLEDWETASAASLRS